MEINYEDMCIYFSLVNRNQKNSLGYKLGCHKKRSTLDSSLIFKNLRQCLKAVFEEIFNPTPPFFCSFFCSELFACLLENCQHEQTIAKAKQIKLIVAQAFFLGKPMRVAAFFFFKPQP